MRRLSLTASVVALSATSVFAQDVDLGEVVVSAGVTPIEENRLGSSFTVITSEQLDNSQYRYVADALRQVPGLAVSRTGSFGGFTQVRIRGSEANEVLVLIDGVEANAVSGGEFDFGSFQVADIERIEVLRGPQSAFWGSNAAAGVINIITKGGIRNGIETSLRSEVGTDATVLGTGTIRGGNDIFDAAFSVAYRQTDGFNISNFGNEKDGDQNLTLNGKFTFDVTSDFIIDGTFRYVTRDSDTDPQDFTTGLVIDRDDSTDVDEIYGSLGGTLTTFDGLLTHRFGFRGSDDQRTNFRERVRSSANEGNRINLYYNATLAFDTPALANAEHQFSAGYEFEREEFRQRPPVFFPSQLETQRRDVNGFIAEYRGAFDDRYFLNAAIRHDDNDGFADATTYSIDGAILFPSTQTRLHASVGTGVTNPTFFEQFGFIPAQFVGNPNLTPEESFGWDVGVEQAFFDGQLIVDVTYFNQDLTNEITTVPVVGGRTPVNLDGTSEGQGIEVAATLQLFDQLLATASYTYTDATEPNGDREVRRPEHTASLNLAYNFLENRAGLFLDLIYNGDMQDFQFVGLTRNRVTLDDYVLVNIGGHYDITDDVQLFGRIENLFDEQYEEVFGYNTQGTTAFLGVKGTFGVFNDTITDTVEPLYRKE